MEIRKITVNELNECERIWSIAFRYAYEPNKGDAKPEQERLVQAGRTWAAFSDEGAMMACMQIHPFEAYYAGKAVRLAGVGGVASLPEYRRGGAIRETFRAWMTAQRAEGVPFSALYPFSHEYYDKFGYGNSWTTCEYALRPSDLVQYRKKTPYTARMLRDGERPDAELCAMIDGFLRGYTLPLKRDEHVWDRWLHEDSAKSMHYRYRISDASGVVAWCCLKVKDNNCLVMTDCAWSGDTGFFCLMGFLSTQASDCTLRLRLPADVDPMLLVPEPYNVTMTVAGWPMLRVLDVPAALSLLKGQGRCVLSVRDPFLPENEGVYALSPDGDGTAVQKVDEAPDMEISVQTLAQLMAGMLGIDGAARKPNTLLYGNGECLNSYFPHRVVWHPDHY